MDRRMEVLTHGELETLTGFRQPARQEVWLKNRGISCFRNARNELVVLRAAVYELLTSRFFDAIDVEADAK